MTKKHLVVALAYDGLCTFEFGCTVELFALDRPELGVDWYEFAVCAVDRGPIRAAGGITVAAPYKPALLARAERPVIVAGSGVWWADGAAALQAFVEASGIPFYTTPIARGPRPEPVAACPATVLEDVTNG